MLSASVRKAIDIIQGLMNDKEFAVNQPLAWDILFNAYYRLETQRDLPCLGGSVRSWWIRTYNELP